MHDYIHTNTYIVTYTDYIHTCMHKHTPIHTLLHTYIRARAHTHTPYPANVEKMVS